MLSRNPRRKCIARFQAFFPVDWLDSPMAAEDDARFRTPSMPRKKHRAIRVWVSLLNPEGEPKDADDREPLQEPVKVEKTELIDAKADVREKRTKTPLEKIELSQLELKAIIMAPSGNKALVEETNGKGYIIRKGTYIGRNDGRVLRILKDKIVVEELTENQEGKMIAREKEIKLPKHPGEE